MSTQDDTIREILQNSRHIAVIGLSPNPARASHGVSAYLKSKGYEITGVHPDGKETLGRPCFTKLALVPPPIDIVDVFRSADAIPGVVDEIDTYMKRNPGAGPKVLWLQEGITHAEAEARARALGLVVIADRCILKEHRRLGL